MRSTDAAAAAEADVSIVDKPWDETGSFGGGFGSEPVVPTNAGGSVFVPLAANRASELWVVRPDGPFEKLASLARARGSSDDRRSGKAAGGRGQAVLHHLYEEGSGRQLWTSDGEVDGTEKPFESVAGADSHDPVALGMMLDRLLLRSDGYQLYAYCTQSAPATPTPVVPTPVVPTPVTSPIRCADRSEPSSVTGAVRLKGRNPYVIGNKAVAAKASKAIRCRATEAREQGVPVS